MHDNKELDKAQAISDISDFVFSHLESGHFHVNYTVIREVVGVIVRSNPAINEIIEANRAEINIDAA